MLAYTISGLCAGLAGVILARQVGIAQPSVGVAFELDAIAACVIGGASLAGGKGSVRATFGGVLVLVLINNLLNLYGVQSFWRQVLKGSIIIAVILVWLPAHQSGARVPCNPRRSTMITKRILAGAGLWCLALLTACSSTAAEPTTGAAASADRLHHRRGELHPQRSLLQRHGQGDRRPGPEHRQHRDHQHRRQR